MLQRLDLRLFAPLLPVQLVNFLLEPFLVSGGNIQTLNRLLDVLQSPSLLLLEHPFLLLEFLGAASLVCLSLLLMGLINAELCEFKLTLLVLSQDSHFLLFTLHLGLELVNQCVFIIPQFKLSLIVQSILLLSDQLLLLTLVVSEDLLSLLVQFYLIFLYLLAKHIACVLRLHL